MDRLLEFLFLQKLEYEKHQFSAQGRHFSPLENSKETRSHKTSRVTEQHELELTQLQLQI